MFLVKQASRRELVEDIDLHSQCPIGLNVRYVNPPPPLTPTMTTSSVVEDFSLPPSPTPMDFTDESDRVEKLLELNHCYLFELIC